MSGGASPITGNGNANDSEKDARRLLSCFHKGISPSPLSRSCVKRCSISPASNKALDALRKEGNERSKTPLEEGFVTPEAKSIKRKPITKEISPGVFYGSPAGKCGKRPPQVLRLLHEIRRDLAAEGYSFSRDRIWVTFAKQDQAIQFAQSHGKKDLAVFTYQDHFTGQRRFLVTTYKEFWFRYEAIPEEYRHHYEIITEGSPCHLYFDLEFDRLANHGLDGNLLVDALLLKVAETLHDVYSLEYDKSWTMELDSTTTGKFSRHIIIRIPKVAFKSNFHVGGFVSEICKRIEKHHSIDERLNDLYVLKGQSRGDCCSQIFIDQAVYSRNRSFRLPFSSKAGKSSRLLPTGRFHFKKMTDREVFEDSLICRVGEDCERLLTFGEVNSYGGSLVCSAMDSHYQKRTRNSEFCISGRSPFPDVDTFIESIACIEGIPGKIRSWYWFSDYGVVVYNIIGNRYCENIGRQHKSNNVMYIVDFRTAGYYQKCHDPDCQGYKSPLRPIPRHTIPPEFPFSLAHGSEMAESFLTQQRRGSHSHPSQLFSCLAIVSQEPENNGNVLYNGSECDDYDDEEEAWWEEVFNHLENLKKNTNSSIVDEESILAKFTPTDDNWWDIVGKELEHQGI